MMRAVVATAIFLAASSTRAGTDPRELVDVAAVIPDAVIDMRYAGADNFTGEILYARPVCKLRRTVATRLARAASRLRRERRRIVVWDCYRPLSVQTELWRRVPDRRYVADPKVGSRHNRGAAVDVSLADLDGVPVAMPTQFDAFGDAAHRANALRGTTGSEARRLDRAMRAAGFTGLSTEWWHFDAPGSFSLSDEPL